MAYMHDKARSGRVRGEGKRLVNVFVSPSFTDYPYRGPRVHCSAAHASRSAPHRPANQRFRERHTIRTC